MYKTIWLIEEGESKTKFTQYHFGENPCFPSWYMEEDSVYQIEMLWNIHIIFSFKTFFKCLFREYIIH